jgi:hypothetical protein
MDSLISFSLRITKAGDRCSYRTAKLLSSTITQPNLRKFELDFQPHRVDQINWPARYGCGPLLFAVIHPHPRPHFINLFIKE